MRQTPSPSTDAIFPQELFDLILENVDDRPTLATCALVDWTWRRRAQAILFRELSLSTMSLEYSRGTTHLPSSVTLFTNSPHICHLIKELSFYDVMITRADVHKFGQAMVSVISSAINLTHLSFEFEGDYGSRIDIPVFWGTVVRPALLSLPHITCVTFLYAEELAANVIDVFKACDGSAVQKIVISDANGKFGAIPSASHESITLPHLVEIKFLTSAVMESLLHPWLTHPVTVFPKLHTITIGVSHALGLEELHAALLLTGGLPGLSCFRVLWHEEVLWDDIRDAPFPGYADEMDMPILAIGTFPEVILDYCIDVYNDIAILWWCRVFENLEVSAIETLSLVVYITDEDLTSLEPWAKLDGILSNWRFHSLKDFTVQFWVTAAAGPDLRDCTRVELSRLEFPEVSRKAKTCIFVGSVLDPEFL